MKTKFKFIAILLIVCLISGYLCACKNKCEHIDEDSDGYCDLCGEPMDNVFIVPEGGYDGSEVTVTFYHTMGANLQEVLDIYVAQFNELYPNITIADEAIGNYDDVNSQIVTQISAGAQPNMAYCYPDHIAYYNIANVVLTLDSLINSEVTVTRADNTTETLGLTQAQIDDFVDAYYEEGSQFGDGLMYSLPFSKSTEVLYYDKTFFDANNLDVPTTWVEMKALCEHIKEIDPNCIPLGYDSESNWFITMCEQYGSGYTSSTEPHYLFNNETNLAFVKEIRSWYQMGYVTTKSLYGAYTSGLFINQDNTKSRSYMSIGSSAGALNQRPTADVNGNYPFEVGIAPIPQVDPDNPKAISQGPSICIFQKDDPQEVLATWLFLKFMVTNIDFQAEFSLASGYVPVLESVADHAVYKEQLDNADGGHYITALSAKVCLEQADTYFESPAFPGSSKARDEVGILLATALVANISGDEDSYIRGLFEDAIDECEY